MEQRRQFTFYRSFWDAIKALPKKDRLAILEAVICYGLDGEEPMALSQSQLAFFLLIKPVLESGRKKARSGRQGGSKPEANSKQTGSKPEANSKQSGREKEVEIEGEKEKEVEIEIENECYTPYPLLPREAETCPSSAAQAPAPGILEGKAFTQFWEDYPKKLDRNNAWEAWKALNPDAETVNAIRAGLAAWKRSVEWLDNGGRYIPSAAKWLTNRRWEYVPPPAKEPIPNGATGGLGAAELDAIRRLMSSPDESEG